MLVNLCIVMKLLLSELDYVVVQNFTVHPCSDWEPHSASSENAPRYARHEQYLTQDVQRYVMKSLFGYKLHEVLLANDKELRLRVKSPVTKVAKIRANSIMKHTSVRPNVRNYIEASPQPLPKPLPQPLPRHPKPVTIIQLRNKKQPNYPTKEATNPDLVKLPAPFDYNSYDKKK